MKKKILTMLIVLCLAMEYAPLRDAGGSGEAAPVIAQSLASEEVSPGDNSLNEENHESAKRARVHDNGTCGGDYHHWIAGCFCGPQILWKSQ